MKATVIITSYNYDRFLPAAIESALAQTHPDSEIIVVDDGSTDESRKVIESYGPRIISLLRQNGGQSASFNAGFDASRGDVVLFLDSDDVLLPEALARSVDLFLAEPQLSKVHWPVQIIDATGKADGRTFPDAPPSAGDLRGTVLHQGPANYSWPPTSGNVWSRSFLRSVLPIPCEEYRTCPDFYLSALAPIFGPIATILEPQSLWRLHGENNSRRGIFDEWLAVEVRRWTHCASRMIEYCKERGLSPDLVEWEQNSWIPRIQLATQTIRKIVPEHETMIFLDGEDWGVGEEISGRRRFPFTEKNGQYGGLPAHDDAAIFELEKLRERGAGFLVIVWAAFWWLDHFSRFGDYVKAQFRPAWQDDRVMIFDLRSAP